MARRTAVVWKCVRPASVVHADRDRYARALAASPSASWIAASSAKTCGSGAPAAAHSASRAFCTSSASTSRPIDRSVHPIIHRAIRCAAASPCAARRSPARVNSASASSNRPSACNAQPRLLRSDASHRLAAGCDDATATASASRFRRNCAAGSVSAKASMWMASTTSASSPAARASGSRRSRCRFDRPPISEGWKPVQRAREIKAGFRPFRRRSDRSPWFPIGLSPQTRERRTPATTRQQGVSAWLPDGSACKQTGRPRERPTG